jgi:choline-sulfatase
MARPNVVFVIADQHRWDFMGYEGNGMTYTPHLDRLAAAGTLFRAAYTTSPLCCPSRAAIASGRYGMNSGCFTNLHQLPPGTPSFVEQFRRQGYRTCAIGKTHMEIHAYDSDLTSDAHRAYMDSLGWDEVDEISGNGMLKTGIRCAYSEYLRKEGVFDQVLEFYRQWHYFMDSSAPPRRAGDPSFVCHEWSLPGAYQEAAFVGDRAVEWLREQDGGRPFFLHVGFAGPHSPIEPSPGYLDPYRDREEAPPWGVESAPGWLPDGRRGYRAMIGQIDAYVGRIYDCLAEKGLAEETIWVYTADHGEMAGDHGLFGKTCFYEPSVRVPLIVAGPGVRPGQRSPALVELIDLGATLCELASVPRHALDQGRSLAPLLRGERASHRATVYAEMGCDKMVRDERYKLMWGEPTADRRQLGRLHLDKPVDVPPSPPRLYDLRQDPHELRDLAREGDCQELLAAMMARLLVRLNENTQTQPFLDRGQYRPPA